MDAAERQRLIARYADGANEVERAIRDIGRHAFDRRPPDGSWNAREVIHHLADSEMTSAIRIRRLLFEDDPVIAGYDEAGYATAFHYADRPSSRRSEPSAPRARRPSRSWKVSTRPRGHGPGPTPRAGRTASSTGCGSTPTTPTSTPTRSAARAAPSSSGARSRRSRRSHRPTPGNRAAWSRSTGRRSRPGRSSCPARPAAGTAPGW